tara:strand:+ start:18 stop:227 length:210 start_codon:yes stop_codon:yes gene_type:complete
MKKMKKRDYDIYLTNLVLTAIQTIEKTDSHVIIPVHKQLDAVHVTIMLNELQWEYPACAMIGVELFTTH